MDAARADERLATHVWHPDANGDLEHLRDGVHVHALVGEPAYQVSSGEIVGLGSENFDYHGQARLHRLRAEK